MTSEHCLGLDLMVDVAISYVDGFTSNLSDEMREVLSRAFSDYLHDIISYDACRQILIQQVGRDDALVQLNEIMTLPDEPIPTHEDSESFEGVSTLRKKTRTWTALEDKRLLAGVMRYGLDNWQLVAHFVGNGRNRAQCSQRWARGLNPKISKKNWTPEDDRQLQELVNKYGDKSWTKIANILGNRSDVQCRYHYKQLTSNNEEGNMPLNKSSITMSSDRLVNKQEPSPAPQRNEEETDTQHMSLFTGRTFLSSPGLTMPKISGMSPLTLPLAPITPRLRHAQELAARAYQENENSNLNRPVVAPPPISMTPLPQQVQKPLPLPPQNQPSSPQSLPKTNCWGVVGTDQQSLNAFLSQFEPV